MGVLADPSSALRMMLILICEHPQLQAAVSGSCKKHFDVSCLSPAQFTPDVPAFVLDATLVLFEWHTKYVGLFYDLGTVLRYRQIPLIALCGDDAVEHVTALAVGADYIEMLPPNPVTVRARLNAYRRAAYPTPFPAPGGDGGRAGLGGENTLYPINGDAAVLQEMSPGRSSQGDALALRVDTQARQVFAGSSLLQLTAMEFELLAMFVQRAHACITRAEILEQVRGIEYDPGTNVVDAHVSRLRCKLRPHGLDALIKTVRGAGYRFAPPDSREGR